MSKSIYFRILILLLVVGCQPATALVNTPLPKVEVTKEILPFPSPSSTPAECTDLPAGAEFLVTATSPTDVQIDLNGMVPGETLVFTFIAKPSPSESRTLESMPIAPVGQDGSYTTTQGGLMPLAEALENTWTIKVIHSRGVACQEITLP